MSDEWFVYRVIGVNGGDSIELDFGAFAKREELEGYREAGYEIHRRMYSVNSHSPKGRWVTPWKLDTPSEEQKKIIEEAGPFGIELMVTAEEKNYKQGWVFIKLKDRYDSMIAGFVYDTIYAPWSHRCPKRKYDNEYRSLDANQKCPDCGAEREAVHER